MHSLPVFLRLEGAKVVLIGDGEPAAARRRLLERVGARIVGEDEADEARIGVIALADADEAQAAAERLTALGLLINTVDRPALCDFTLPAIIDRDPVIVAIGTGGVSAGLAAALRQRLEALLPATLGRMAEALHEMRDALRARFPDGGERRRAITALLAPGAELDPLPGIGGAATGEAYHGAPRIERLTIVSADPDQLTLRAARLLGQADRLYYAAGLPPAILDRARADAQRILGRAPVRPLSGLSVELGWRREG